jgi:hypothetical protein
VSDRGRLMAIFPVTEYARDLAGIQGPSEVYGYRSASSYLPENAVIH